MSLDDELDDILFMARLKAENGNGVRLLVDRKFEEAKQDILNLIEREKAREFEALTGLDYQAYKIEFEKGK